MARHRGLRAELASILCVDQYTQADTAEDPPPPVDDVSNRLAHLIAQAARHDTDTRTVQAFLPVLMLRIFGFTAGQGWLETISAYPFKDRDALLSVVEPNGPLHTFCELNSHPHLDTRSSLASPDLRFEFAVSNLPQETQAALSPSAAARGPAPRSLLAPMLKPLLKPDSPGIVLLSPLQYFFICMVASPFNKYTLEGSPEGVSPFTQKRIKRSSSLPSTRALYNTVIAAYASALSPTDRADNGSVFLPAVLDFLFVPLAVARSDSQIHYSAAAADAVASILLTLVPQTPDALDLETTCSLSSHVPPLDLKMLTNTAAVYRLIPYMLQNVFDSLSQSEQVPTPFAAYLRIFALYLAPWRGPVRDALRNMLFPKPRSASQMSPKPHASGLQALSTTISNMSAQLSPQERSPNNASQTKEARWRAVLAARQTSVDRPLLRLAVVRAPTQSLANASDGNRTLSLLSDAAAAARLPVDPAAASDEELFLCLDALRGQRAQTEQRSGKWDRNYVAGLAAALGARAPSSGMFAGISGIMAGGAQSVRGVVNKVSGRSSATPGPTAMKVRERRLRALSAGSVQGEVPFLGSVWDRPIAQGEAEPLVLAAYWLALRLEPSLGYVPDTRFMGQIWVWALVGLLASIYVAVRSLVSALT